jgi:diketogulonate reductase-like aldo/keto reductase
MIARTIPKTKESLPAIGLGSYHTFDVSLSNAQGTPRAVIDAFVRQGGRLIDSSPMYGGAEAVIGAAVGSLRIAQKLFIATKVWITGREAGIRQMEDSFRKFGVEKIDLMQVHNLLDIDTHFATLEQWREQGRIRYIGVTHYAASAHSAVANVLRSRHVDFVQINYSLAEREAEQTVLPLAADRGVAVIVNRPFAGGGLLRRLAKRPLPPCAKELGCESWAQLALKFAISHPAVTCAIPATSNAAHLNDYMRAGEGQLPDERMRKEIAAALQ